MAKRYAIPKEQMSLFQFGIPSMPVLDVSRCEARIINHETAARMVETYHYAHRVPSIVVAVGMYVDGTLAGCLSFGMLASPNAQKAALGPRYADKTLELNRLFVHSWAGRNSESWLISRALKYLRAARPECAIVISYADIGEKHIGYVYQASNWTYTGLSIPGGNGNEMFVDGIRMTTKNAFDRFGSQGIKELEAQGHTVIKPKGTYKHRYVYFLGSKRQRKALRKALRWPVLPYPKG
jgi:hypothetical protein